MSVEWRRLKSIIIFILLLVNGFLLVLVGIRRGEAQSYERKALERTIEVLREKGIAVEQDNLSDSGQLLPLSIERNLEQEARIASILLDEEVQAENRGGGLYLYRGVMGEVSIRAGGELSAVLTDNAHWQTGYPDNHAAALLKSLKLDARQIGGETAEDRTVVRFRQLWNGVPVFSCELEFIYEHGSLSTIHGTLLIAGQTVQETGETLTLPTALMRFLDGVTAAGDVCSSIESMEAGYRAASHSASGGIRLTAVWLISSNTADYYLDGVTGALTRLADQ